MWIFQGREFTEEDVADNYGFIYLITHIETNRKYIGRKYFTKSKTTQLKGKKKRSRVSSDWVDYWSSSKTLKDEIEIQGTDKYTREILHLCKNRSECSYFETYEIFVRNALMSDAYYNDWVSCKIRKAHLKKSHHWGTYVLM